MDRRVAWLVSVFVAIGLSGCGSGGNWSSADTAVLRSVACSDLTAQQCACAVKALEANMTPDQFNKGQDPQDPLALMAAVQRCDLPTQGQ